MAKPSVAGQAYKIGQVATPPAPEPKITTIEYKGGVVTADGSKGGLVLRKQNIIAKYQRFFQKANANSPVHLASSRDQIIYKGAMVGSLIGMSFCFFAVYRLALPPKN